MKKCKNFTLIEGIISIMLFTLIIGLLRFIVIDSNIYANSIKYNNNQIIKMQNLFIAMDNDLNYSYNIAVEEDKIVAQTATRTIIYEKKDGFLFRNDTKMINLDNIDIYFYDVTNDINNKEGKTIVKLDVIYNKEYKLKKTKVNFTKYINTQEES